MSTKGKQGLKFKQPDDPFTLLTALWNITPHHITI